MPSSYSSLPATDRKTYSDRILRHLKANGDCVSGSISTCTAIEKTIVDAALLEMLNESPPRVVQIRTKYASKWRAVPQLLGKSQ